MEVVVVATVVALIVWCIGGCTESRIINKRILADLQA